MENALEFCATVQIMEALGPVNQWFCSIHFKRRVDDVNTLIKYYIDSGGAADFRRRFIEATGHLNKWYCSQHYNREVSEFRILWDYYMRHREPPMDMAC
jgi:hypothetical protein